MHLELSPQTNLRSPSLSADSWGRYYTQAWVSEHLIDAIESQQPRVILELGSGDGALAAAASWKWNTSRVITVDIDEATTNRIKGLQRGEIALHNHFIHDVLDDNLPSHLGIQPGTVDIAVCNPPYIRPRWQAKFASILEHAGLSGSLSCIKDAGADLLFIAQNLRLLKQNGKLGLILPDGLITAEKFAGVRKVLLAEHRVEQVVQLPRRAFANTEAQTYLMVLSKCSGPTDTVTLRQLDGKGEASKTVTVTADRAQRRLDYSFHHFTKQQHSSRKNKGRPLGEYVQEVVRGSVSSHEIKGFPAPVFHLTDFALPGATVPQSFEISKCVAAKIPAYANLAVPGDLLMARIGRNHFKKLAAVAYGPCLVSDCVFIIRVDDSIQRQLLKYFSSLHGQHSLQSISRGVGARYITTSDLLALEVRV